MASGNSSNANRYKGEDIDTDGDGSVNDSQTLQGNQPSDLGNTIDKDTIQENANGNIQVNPPFRGLGFKKLGKIDKNNSSLSIPSGIKGVLCVLKRTKRNRSNPARLTCNNRTDWLLENRGDSRNTSAKGVNASGVEFDPPMSGFIIFDINDNSNEKIATCSFITTGEDGNQVINGYENSGGVTEIQSLSINNALDKGEIEVYEYK